MERKTKHRILGVLVIVGLVVLAIPFFQGKKDIPPQQVLAEMPPFPDKPTEVAPPIAQNELQNESVGNQQTITTAQNIAAANTDMPDDVIRVVRPNIINAPIPVTKPADAQIENVNDQATVNESSQTPVNKPSAHSLLTDAVSNAQAKQAKIKVAQNNPKTHVIKNSEKIKSKVEANGLAKLKGPAWVIQLGSFKNKANAMRLVNQLRAKGYRAFIQQVSTAVGGSTRVFVGPETKHTEARNTARQLESDMHIRGIVISYKPLTL